MTVETATETAADTTAGAGADTAPGVAGGTWIFLRGMLREQRHWGDFPERFRRAIPGSVVITPDLPGNGSLHDQPSLTSIEDTVAWLRAEVRRRGVSGPVHLLANSLGGMVALAWAAAAPEEVAGAVLVNSSQRGYSRFYERFRPVAWPVLLRMLLTAPSAQRVESDILALISRHAEGGDPRADWARWRLEAPVSRRNGLRQLIAAARFRTPRSAPAGRLLLLASDGDRLVDPRCSTRLAEAWGSAIAVHPSAGHDLPLDAPDWVIARVRDWLAA